MSLPAELLKPSVLMSQGETEKHSELIADRRADGIDENNGPSSTSISSEVGRKEETQNELQPPAPRSARKRRSRVVILGPPPAANALLAITEDEIRGMEDRGRELIAKAIFLA